MQGGFEFESIDRPREDHIDILLVAVKADQTLEAIKPLLPRLCSPGSSPRERPSTIVLLQNGVGQDDAIRHHCAATRTAPLPYIVIGSNSHGTWRRSQLETVHAAKGEMIFALPSSLALRPETESILLRVANGEEGPPCAVDEQFTPLLQALKLLLNKPMADALATKVECWPRFQVRVQRKLVANCVLNPLTFLNNVKNGEVLRAADLQTQAKRIIRECAAVLAARCEDDGMRADVSYAALERYVFDVVELTRDNWSSMVQDGWSKRPSTEIDFLNGIIVEWANALHIDAVENKDLVRRVKQRVEDGQM